jgi:hypothetical protein
VAVGAVDDGSIPDRRRRFATGIFEDVAMTIETETDDNDADMVAAIAGASDATGVDRDHDTAQIGGG